MERANYDRIHFRSGPFTIGSFTCRPGDPGFDDTGPIGGYLLVFPRTAVTITHAGCDSDVADRTVVMTYNLGQEYRRDPLSPEGDHCDWFAVAPEAVVDVAAAWDPTVLDRPSRPFRFRRGPADASLYLAQRQLVTEVSTGAGADAAAVEEGVLTLLEGAVAASYRVRGFSPVAASPGAWRRQRALVEAVREELARDHRVAVTLADLGDRLGASPFHLSRLFRRYTGTTVHRYRDELRLRYALGRLRDPRADLTEVALDAGYSSHSHFGRAFRRAFGAPPSAIRARLAGRARS